MRLGALAVLSFCFCVGALANAEVKRDPTTLGTGIIGLSETNRDALLGCQISNGFFTKAGVQYSDSGKRIELIRFKRKDGFVWAIPTNFSSLSNVDNDIATNIIENEKVFFVRFSVCGNGGYPSLIDLYIP